MLVCAGLCWFSWCSSMMELVSLVLLGRASVMLSGVSTGESTGHEQPPQMEVKLL